MLDGTDWAGTQALVTGHVVSERSGMKYCAEWLKPLLPEVAVEFIAAPEPYWNPEHPSVVR